MSRRSCAFLVCALAVGPLAGCGASGGAKVPTVSLAVKLQEAVAYCEKEMTASPYIPAAEKATAKADCAGIRTGRVSTLRAIVERACERFVAKLPKRDLAAATAACKKLY